MKIKISLFILLLIGVSLAVYFLRPHKIKDNQVVGNNINNQEELKKDQGINDLDDYIARTFEGNPDCMDGRGLNYYFEKKDYAVNKNPDREFLKKISIAIMVINSCDDKYLYVTKINDQLVYDVVYKKLLTSEDKFKKQNAEAGDKFYNHVNDYNAKCNDCLWEGMSGGGVEGASKYYPRRGDGSFIIDDSQGGVVKEGIQPAYCTEEATSREIGGVIMPINPRYKNIEKLGQLFTAVECGSERISEIDGVNGENYDIGSTIWLNNAPNLGLFNALYSIGYVCSDGNINEDCMKWSLKKTVKIKDLMKLEPYSDNFKLDDCVMCG